ncbi:MAG: peptidylprolyl isomerase [Candidatus Woesearchaeota archaeon]
MKEDEYIDLDKINVSPNGKDVPGLPKEEKNIQESTIAEKKQIPAEKKISQNTKVTKKTTKATKTQTAKKTTKTKKVNTNIKKTKPKKQNSNKIIYLLIGLILLAIAIILIVRLTMPEEEITEQRVSVLINGEALHQDEIQTRAQWLRLINGMPITDEQAIDLSTDIELLYREAKKQNISVTEDEIDEIFNQMALSGGLTQTELTEFFEDLELNTKILRTIIKKEMIAGKLIEQETNTELTEAELRDYYEKNPQLFVHDELARIRHIQINFENKTEEETLAKAQEIKDMIHDNQTNFCELVQEHTNDLNTIQTCGEYIFEKQNQYEDNLTNKSFELNENETAIVKTTFGYHVLLKKEKINAGISSFEDVQEIVEAQLEKQKSEEQYIILLEQLRANATIEKYTEQQTQDEPIIGQKINNTIQEIDNKTQNTTQKLTDKIENITEDAEDIIEEIDEDIKETIENTTNITENALEDTQELTENETTNIQEEQTQENTEITYTEPIILEDEDTKALRLAKCLSDMNAKVYTVFWSPHSQDQKEIFGEYAEHLKIIECDPEGINPKITECKNTLNKEFPTWPTWQINGKLHEGYQNLNNLAKISGCEY